jgi:hypothetical protein
MKMTWIAIAIAVSAVLGARADSFLDRFKDPEDGKFDASEYLLDHKGALPVPIIITEPAVGYGGGLALAWFSESLREAARHSTEGRYIPPDIYGLAAFATENGTKGAAGGARMSFDQGRWLYRGAIADVTVNLDFYGIGGDLAPGLDKVGYNLKGGMLFQEINRRIGDTSHFIGARYLYLDLSTRLQAGLEEANLTSRELARRSSELGVRWSYDSRDNIFAATGGVEAAFDAMFSDPSLGSDNRFQTYRTHAFVYTQPTEGFVAAFRADARSARGDVPFYQLPFIDMRGIPAARYQDQNVGVLETELRYYVTPRWIALGFIGAGRAWGRDVSFDGAASRVSKGIGFRYVVARRLGLAVGIDVARGPEQTAYYLQVGSSWR